MKTSMNCKIGRANHDSPKVQDNFVMRVSIHPLKTKS